MHPTRRSTLHSQHGDSPSPTRRRRTAVAAASATALLALVAAAGQLSSPASAAGNPSCADSVRSAPTGPATVSAASTAFGKVLVVGSGDYAGCSLYLLT